MGRKDGNNETDRYVICPRKLILSKEYSEC